MNMVEFSRSGSKKSRGKVAIWATFSMLNMLSMLYLPKNPIFTAASLLVATVCLIAILLIVYRE